MKDRKLPKFVEEYIGAIRMVSDMGGKAVFLRSTWSEPIPSGYLDGCDVSVVSDKDGVRQALSTSKAPFNIVFTDPTSVHLEKELHDIAVDVGSETGVPCIVRMPTGTNDHIFGMMATLDSIIDRFPIGNGERKENVVNVLGYTDLECMPEDLEIIKQRIVQQGKVPNVVTSSLDSLRDSGMSGMSVVMTVAGIGLARRLEKEYEVPWTVFDPFKTTYCSGGDLNRSDKRVLFIGEQVRGVHVKSLLARRGIPCDVSSLSPMDYSLMSSGDRYLSNEGDLDVMVTGYSAIVADPRYSDHIPEGTDHIHDPVLSIVGDVAEKRHTIADEYWIDEMVSSLRPIGE